jgi:general secretion pathway protein F
VSVPIYRYKAVDPAGDVATGELDAANESEIVERLRDQGMLPMQVARATGTVAGPESVRPGTPPRRSWFAAKGVNRDQQLAITRELATLLNAGLPLDRALETLIGLATAAPASRCRRRSMRGATCSPASTSTSSARARPVAPSASC